MLSVEDGLFFGLSLPNKTKDQMAKIHFLLSATFCRGGYKAEANQVSS